MAEEYVGVKFNYQKIAGKITDRETVEKAVQLDHETRAFVKTTGNEGNLSVRGKNGFIIKATGSRMTTLSRSDFSEVIGANMEDFCIYFNGKLPSSESFMHYLIYQKRQDVGFVLHFHADELLEKLRDRYKSVGPFEYGSLEQAIEVSEVLADGNVVIIKDHGLVIAGKDKEGIISTLKRLFDTTG